MVIFICDGEDFFLRSNVLLYGKIYIGFTSSLNLQPIPNKWNGQFKWVLKSQQLRTVINIMVNVIMLQLKCCSCQLPVKSWIKLSFTISSHHIINKLPLSEHVTYCQQQQRNEITYRNNNPSSSFLHTALFMSAEPLMHNAPRLVCMISSCSETDGVQ